MQINVQHDYSDAMALVNIIRNFCNSVTGGSGVNNNNNGVGEGTHSLNALLV